MSDQHLWEKVKEETYCDPRRRMDFVLLFDVKDGNPNGDPDAGNLPRMDPTTRHGIVTDVCIKRKVRDYLATALGRRIFIQSQAALNTLYYRVAQEVATYNGNERKGQEDRAAVEPLYVELDASNSRFMALVGPREEDSSSGGVAPSFRDWLGSIDVEGVEFNPACTTLSYLGEARGKRDFQQLLKQEDSDFEAFTEQIDELAAVLSEAKQRKKGGEGERRAREVVKRRMCEAYDDIRLFGAVLTAGTNAGQIRGPLQVTFGRSLEPILPQDAAITRCAITKASDWNRKQTEFGRKPWLSYAVYRQHGFYNAPLGDPETGTGVTREDMARFWEAFACMFPNSASASKGEMATRDLVVFVHPNARGNAPSHRLLERVTATKDDGGRPALDLEPADKERIELLHIEVKRPLQDMWGDL